MNWTVILAPKSSLRDVHKYEVSAKNVWYAKIKATILYIKENRSRKTPSQLMKDLEIQVKCHTDGRLADYSALGVV